MANGYVLICTCGNDKYNAPCRKCRKDKEEAKARAEFRKELNGVFTWDESSVLI